MSSANSFVYIFLDEGGDLDFSASGSRYFTMTSITTVRPFPCTDRLINLKYELIELGLDIEYFHATEDRQAVRDQVFAIVQAGLSSIRINSLIVEKQKTAPALQVEDQFYPRMLGFLLKYVVRRLPPADEILVLTDRIPIQRKRRAIEKAIKVTLARELPEGVKHRLLHHSSMSCMGLQIADYCNWAIFRKWERGDVRSYELIKSVVESEFDIFRRGKTLHYDRPEKK
jgi:hypothetical protein